MSTNAVKCTVCGKPVSGGFWHNLAWAHVECFRVLPANTPTTKRGDYAPFPLSTAFPFDMPGFKW